MTEQNASTPQPQPTTPSPTAPPPRKKSNAKWWWIGGIAGFIIIGAIAGGKDKERTRDRDDDVKVPSTEASTQTEKADEPVASTETAPPTSTPGGIGISRAEMQAEVPGMTFEKGADVDGQENYVATMGAVTMQMIGPAEELTNVSATATLNLTDQEQVKNMAGVILAFCQAVNKDASDWVLEQMTSLEPSKLPLRESKDMAGPNPHLQILPLDENIGMLTLTFEEE